MNKTEQVFVRKIFKQGDSIAVTIPIQIARELNLQEGDFVSIELNSNTIKIKKFFK